MDWMQMIMAAAPQADKPKSPMESFIMLFVMIILAFYFIILRPQKREQQQKQQMLNTVEKGDRIVTIGGIHGVVAGVDQTKNTVHVDIGKKVNIEFSRNAISTVEKKNRKSAEQQQ